MEREMGIYDAFILFYMTLLTGFLPLPRPAPPLYAFFDLFSAGFKI